MKYKTPEVRLTVTIVGILTFFLSVMPAFPAHIVSVSPANYPEFADDLSYDGLDTAIDASIRYYKKLPASRVFEFGPDKFVAGELAAGLKIFKRFIKSQPSQTELNSFVEKHIKVYAFAEDARPVQVLFTGYYEPLLSGSVKESAKYSYPVYSRPKDLVRVRLSEFDGNCAKSTAIGRYTGESVVPYYDRKTIETENVLETSAKPIAWVADPVKLFFLHVQGSGRIEFKSGRTCRVQYDITNGRPYRSIGKYLIDNGKISRKKMSMQAIYDYISSHPREMQEIFFYNPRYVFFKAAQGRPVGSVGVPLTPGRSVALDQTISPSGAILFVSAKKPVCDDSGGIDHWEAFSRFMCSHDAGSAIRGPKRADIFWGSGDYAEKAAGYMKHRGTLYFIVIEPASF